MNKSKKTGIKPRDTRSKVDMLQESISRDYVMDIRETDNSPDRTTTEWKTPMDAMSDLAHKTRVQGMYDWTSAVCYLKTNGVYVPQWTIIVH